MNYFPNETPEQLRAKLLAHVQSLPETPRAVQMWWHYRETALWATTDEQGRPLDRRFGSADYSDEAEAQMIEDCERFLQAIAHLDVALDLADLGHDFWLTRNRHGAGFWDRGLGELGKTLTEIAHSFGECDLYVGDDGRLYL